MKHVKYLIQADERRRTRFHTLKGELIGWSGLSYLPLALGSTLLRRCLGLRPPVPWIPYSAISAISRLLCDNWNVLEFGSGMSTVWLASRCNAVYSIENDPQWYEIVAALLKAHCVRQKVRYELRSSQTYTDVSMFPDGFFDLCIVDGEARAECLQNSVSKVKPGGYIYLDNSDNDSADGIAADRLLVDAVKQRNSKLRYFVGFPPTAFHSTEGCLARI